MSKERSGNDSSDRTCMEESLMSLEKLDRSSPDLWPEQSVGEFIHQNLEANQSFSWLNNLNQEDMNNLHQLGNLTMTGLIAEVKKLHDTAYQLGLEEAKEMTRGKYLNIFKHK
ncbi:protein lin-52 homolog isoform X2 [Chelonus insularis]|uniref:protein lin-52 homolog isoform X2 n=1 Tax=Chelonus insularis TaxID=460826 RepID=UPI00158F1D5C|nr:protein lin-52 homolog isoform X2 [Chelonus insularis]